MTCIQIANFLFKGRPEFNRYIEKIRLETDYTERDTCKFVYFANVSGCNELYDFLNTNFGFVIERIHGPNYFILRREGAKELLANVKISLLKA